jgi:hypothetical protein
MKENHGQGMPPTRSLKANVLIKEVFAEIQGYLSLPFRGPNDEVHFFHLFYFILSTSAQPSQS